MKPVRVSALAAALLLAACTSSPSPTSADPAGPSFDGGASLGSGNYTEAGGNMIGSGTAISEDGGGSLGSGNYTASDTTGRGGNMIGSGN